MKKLSILLVLMVAFAYIGQAQGLKYVKIKTTAHTEMCKEKIESTLNKEKGVKEAKVDLSTKVVSVGYDETKTSYEKILAAVTEIGFVAEHKPGYKKSGDCNKSTETKSNCQKKCSGHK